MVMSDCKRFRPLIPGYLDGELSEDQASPLRKHLMDCRSCRTATQGEKALKGWFVAAEAITVPEGFAAHVARRAFAGDRGERTSAGVLGEEQRKGALLNFVLTATAAAAALLLLLAGGLGGVGLPAESGLRADDVAPITEAQVLRNLERLNSGTEPELAGGQSATPLPGRDR
jgi:anti-sigma factor RsiW